MVERTTTLFSLVLVFLLLLSSLIGVMDTKRTSDDAELDIDLEGSEEKGENSRSLSNNTTYPFSNDYPPLKELYHWYDDLVSNHSEICKKIKVGESWEGRDLIVIKVSDNVSQDEEEPEVLIDGNIHAREWSAHQAAAYMLWRVTKDYDTNETIHWLVDNREIFVAPMLNPDGYYHDGNGNISDSPDPSGWRKNARDNNNNGGFDPPYYDDNEMTWIYPDGVDLNRNWDIDWGNNGTDTDPDSNIYCGPSPFSEPETKNYTDWILNRDIQSYQNIHSHAGTLLIPWCYANDASVTCPHDSWYRSMAGDMTSLTSMMGDSSQHYGYGTAAEEIYYGASGGANDWVYNATGAHGLTYEIYTGGTFHPSEDKIMPINRDLYDSLVYQARVADTNLGNGTTDLYPPEPYIVYGNVEDDSGKPVVDETVEIENKDTGEIISIETDENGYYELDFGTLTEHGYTDNDSFVIRTVGKARYFTIGEEWGRKIDLQYKQQKSITLSLDKGWNLVSSPLVPRNTSLSAVLDDPSDGIEGNYTKVMAYDNPLREAEKVAWEEDFEASNGWTIQGGEWEIGSPQGEGGAHDSPDPTTATSGTRVLGCDLNGLGSNPGDYEDEIISTEWAVSPSIDLTGYSNLSLEFERWLGLEKNMDDQGYIEVYDGVSWNQIWVNPDSYILESSWNHVEYDISQYADGNPNFKIRFGIETDQYWHACGWNIDNLTITYQGYEEVEQINGWGFYMPERPSHFNSLDRFTPNQGYWIKMSQPDNLTIRGAVLNATALKLKPGWNLVGYPSNTSMNNGLPAAIDKIGFHSSSAEYEIEYTTNTTGFTFEPGHAYWVHNPTDRAISWDVDY